MEFDLIDVIRARCDLARADVVLGIGDDAALLAPPPGHELAVSTDALVEGVHFPRGTAPRDVGWKALAVNLSDLAAMGATPAWALLALTLPQADAEFVDAFASGFAELEAARHQLHETLDRNRTQRTHPAPTSPAAAHQEPDEPSGWTQADSFLGSLDSRRSPLDRH